VVSEVLNLVRASLPSRIRVEIEHGPDVPEIFADPTQVHQVILNLCTNAVQAMGDKGLLRVRTERALFETEYSLVTPALPPGLYAKLVIEDSGSGMDRPTLERIFEPFFTTKTQGTGTGLGLSMVHGIVKSHAGGIYVESTPCHGSSFSIYFPAAGS
jgi:signal transduction histidine kinase